ncbi:hypothetical protein [Arenibacter lacus]|uniref:hypothetical protein n=1 Tax=Arenibacter lacus TaxID=2608629 RepID=UPI00123C82B8|nr:hypothetical protein [Arenibacter lacus]
MEIIKIYQTLEDRDNADYIEDNGPFQCSRKNAWLGNGYYFWDTFIENAHWWGGLLYDDKYVITEAKIDFCISTCFDLVGSAKHMLEFENLIELMKEKGLVTEKTTVARVISFVKDTLQIFQYDAVRVYGIQSRSVDTTPSYRMNFELGKTQYLDFKPAIQICIYRTKPMNFRDYQIVYPDEYISGYVI